MLETFVHSDTQKENACDFSGDKLTTARCKIIDGQVEIICPECGALLFPFPSKDV